MKKELISFDNIEKCSDEILEELFYSEGLFKGHDVVVYGYQESDAGTYFMCHMGWSRQKETKVFIKPSSISIRHGYAYLTGDAI